MKRCNNNNNKDSLTNKTHSHFDDINGMNKIKEGNENQINLNKKFDNNKHFRSKSSIEENEYYKKKYKNYKKNSINNNCYINKCKKNSVGKIPNGKEIIQNKINIINAFTEKK